MNSLSTRLVAAFFLIIVLVLLIVGVTLLLLLRDSPLVERLAVTRLNEAARAVIDQAVVTPEASPDVLETKIRKIAQDYDLRVLITTDKGDIRFDSAAPDLPPLNFNRFRL